MLSTSSPKDCAAPGASASPTRKVATTVQKPRLKYAQPLPVRTFPLPAFYPSNPVSLFHLAVAWLGQLLQPPPAEPATVYKGIWSAATRSIHVTDAQAMNDLWCQGFYGKGSLSRSEPNWLRREKARLSSLGAATSEQYTMRRREERADIKWERGRTELEAIEQRRRSEEVAERKIPQVDAVGVDSSANGIITPPASPLPGVPSPNLTFKAPVGPRELLALPNSEADLRQAAAALAKTRLAAGGSSRVRDSSSPVQVATANGHAAGHVDGSSTPLSLDPLKRQKSVRFSPKVRSTTFVHSDPPSPSQSELATSEKAGREDVESQPPAAKTASVESATIVAADDIPNKEHLQLSAEEAFFLSYAVGALRVFDPQTHEVLSTPLLFELFRQYSYFPPRSSSTTALSTDDPFLVHYAVYHHFRSLGWVPRHGIKFGVSWMLYGKGPALDHAEFGVLVLPSYTHPEWALVDPSKTQQTQPKSWHLLHSVNRVLSTVFKGLVLVYVDIPPPSAGAVLGQEGGISALLAQYRIREVMVRRWSSNRNRD
ncbi:tRNA splicing endonuclease subunit sen2 [Sporothrix epigloea]|uniref:tRNA-intron lyase n=1 Tax=Sporothrix epigloea TaxID=1892477 RepID=A0ABP0DIC5_9PEZI